MGPTGRFVVGTTVVQPLIGGHAFRNGLHMLKREKDGSFPRLAVRKKLSATTWHSMN